MARIDSREVEREKLAILRVLGSASNCLGSQVICVITSACSMNKD
jgi:HTH-type transcriptional regulator, global nitrogen regulator NrpRI